MPTLRCCRRIYERKALRAGYVRVAGVDEVGRGCLFGPVCAAAVILPPDVSLPGLRDSKQLTAEERQEWAVRLRECVIAWAVAEVGPDEIDRLNIRRASLLAMQQAVAQLSPAADYLLVDAFPLDTTLPQNALIQGDARESCIAAASILAKVHRDSLLDELDRVYPGYGLARHKGYPTDEHVRALEAYGLTPLHRKSFGPVRRLAEGRV